MNAISYCKVYPPIGIARLGDSVDPNGFYVGPEWEGHFEHKKEGFSFRDDEGRIKRQVARFRIYGFDAKNKLVGEITSDQAEITWTSQLANRKASWFKFRGTNKAMDAFEGKHQSFVDELRNNSVGTMKYDPKAPNGAKYIADKERSEILDVVSEIRSISGTSVRTNESDPKENYVLGGKFKRSKDVYLGELRTDEKGRLLVFGGRGKSEAINDSGESISSDRWIASYANNDDWYDDTSDGFVKAEVVLKSTGKQIEVRGNSWVVVASPSYAPDTKNIVTLFDVMEEVLHDNKQLHTPEVPLPREPSNVVYEDDILPVFERMFEYRWVNDLVLRGHGYGKPGDFKSVLTKDLADKESANGRKLRDRIFRTLRAPVYRRHSQDGSVVETAVSVDVAKKQATTSYMPPLSGDEGDREAGAIGHWLSVTHLQYERIAAWGASRFVNRKPKEKATPEGQPWECDDAPFILTRTVLEQCVGGAFYPGIEMTSLARHPHFYKEAYRINEEVLRPGDVTMYMALPWQADFYACRGDWWPAQRPDDVVVDEDFEEVFRSFQEEKTGDLKGAFELVLFGRKKWDRGIGQSRPTARFINQQLLAAPQKGQGIDDYLAWISTFVAEEFLGRTVVGKYEGLKIIDVKYLERLPSPWRIQYLVQETLDRYSGRFFHLVAPSPDDVLHSRTLSKKHPKIAESDWRALCISSGEEAVRVLNRYAQGVSKAVKDSIKSVINNYPRKPTSTIQEIRDELLNVRNAESIVARNTEDFSSTSEVFFKAQLANMFDIVRDLIYERHSWRAGYNDMVDKWRELGFVVATTRLVNDNTEDAVTVTIEVERGRYDGLSFRDYFYILMNIEKYPDFRPYAKRLANRFLEQAQEFIERPGLQEENGHPESFVVYNESNYDAKLEQIYEILRAGAAGAEPWKSSRNVSSVIDGILRNAPFNQTDGSWLRNISEVGPSDEIHGLLFDIWSDEIGNGIPSLHHGNIYTALLQQLGHFLPEVNSRAYADNPDIHEQNFIGAVVPLAISEHSKEFFPELLGMTLFLEWEVLSLVPFVKLLDYLGINSHFYRMHVAIDNATEGHGYAAKQAVKRYLDHVSKDAGSDAVQDQWRRIWNGFVAFALGGNEIFSNDGNQSDQNIERKYPGTPEDQVKDLIVRKREYGNLNHLKNQIGEFRINDLFDSPDLFIEELSHSPWITPGDPKSSRLLNHLTTFSGPMYKVFDADDLSAWRDWIEWLGKDGSTPSPKEYLGKAESMLILLTELREQAMAAQAHTRYKLEVNGSKDSIAELFGEPDLKKLMRALADPANGWIVPGVPEESPLIMDLARGDRSMGRALDRRYPALGNEIGRMVLIRWVDSGCPIPGDKPPHVSRCAKPPIAKPRKLLVQEFGIGAVH